MKVDAPAMSFLRYASPSPGLAGRWQDRLANAAPLKRLCRATLGRLPFPVLESDVRDVVYANWIVPVVAVAGHVPPGVTIVEADGMTILTVLTYRHGHFGPVLAGPLRRWFPSPLQSNWRLYVRSIDGTPPPVPTVLFLANIFDTAIHALGTRLFSDVMVAHHGHDFVHRCAADGWTSRVDPGGSAADWALEGCTSPVAELPPAFAPFFPDHRTALDMLCLQDAAIAPVADIDALAWADIDLPIDATSVVPLDVTAFRPGAVLRSLGAIATPFCFRVPTVRFRALSERIIRRESRAG